MNIQQIKYILAVAELKYFGAAAEQCFVTQSTLSTMIGKFEDEIGIKVFDRKTKPVTVTKEGEVLLDQLKLIIREIDNLEESVKLLKGELSGEFKIGIIPTVAPYLLPRFLSNFAKRYPDLQFSVTEQTTESIIKKLDDREIDLGIVALPLNAPDLLEYPLYNEEFVLFDCTSDGTSAAKRVEEINKSKLCLLAEGHCLSQQIVNLCNLKKWDAKSDLNFDFKAGSIDSLIRFVRQSEGITLLPYLAILDFSKADKKRISSFEGVVPVRSVGILTHKNFVKTKIRDLLISEIKKKVQSLLPKNEGEVQVALPV